MFMRQILSVNTSESEGEFADHVMQLQIVEHNDEAKVFHWVQTGNLDLLQKTLISNPKLNIEAVDASGANVVHLAYLYEYYKMGHWLVEKYPALALRPYSDQIPEVLREQFKHEKMLFTGENILHIVIVRRNYEEVRWSIMSNCVYYSFFIIVNIINNNNK